MCDVVIAHPTQHFSPDRARPSAFLRKKERPAFSEGGTKLRRRNACNAPKNFSEIARAGIADLEPDFDEAPRGLTNKLLATGDPLSRHELQRRHSRCLLEYTGKVEGAQVHQLGQG